MTPKNIGLIFFCLLFFLTINSYGNNLDKNNSNSRFLDNKDGTILDKKTGLIWKKCCEGQEGNECNNNELKVFTWDDALTHSKNINNSGGFAGSKNWRIPTLNELRTITDKSFNDPSINLSIFPNTPSDYFWSSSADSDNPNYAWGVNFCIGEDYYGGKQRLRYIRLIRTK